MKSPGCNYENADCSELPQKMELFWLLIMNIGIVHKFLQVFRVPSSGIIFPSCNCECVHCSQLTAMISCNVLPILNIHFIQSPVKFTDVLASYYEYLIRVFHWNSWIFCDLKALIADFPHETANDKVHRSSAPSVGPTETPMNEFNSKCKFPCYPPGRF